MSRSRIIITAPYFRPSYRAGGPIQSLQNIVAGLGEDFDFHVISTDRDISMDRPHESLTQGQWQDLGGVPLLPMDRKQVGLSTLQRQIADVAPDAIYASGFFNRVFTQRLITLSRLGMLTKVPLIVAPRGEFSNGALAFKRMRKSAGIALGRTMGLYKSINWHATNMTEADNIRQVIGSTGSIHIASNIPSSHPVQVHPSKAASVDRDAAPKRMPLSLAFLSRISPKKNLLGAIQSLSYVNCDAHFSIYGPIEDAKYWDKCQHALDALPVHIEYTYCGAITHDRVTKELSKHDVFLLLSHGENYGHVIHEALASGLYVLTTDQTPWNELDEMGIGRQFAVDEIGLVAKKIDALSRKTPETWQEIRRSAQSYAFDSCHFDEARDAHRTMFMAACANGAE